MNIINKLINRVNTMNEANEPDQTQLHKSFIERLADNMGLNIINKLIFGEPLTHEGMKIVPVAKVRYGFGGGYGHKQPASTGKGGGGGAMVQPVGYIEMADNQAVFKPIRIPASLPLLIVTLGIAGFLLCKGMRRPG